MQGMTVCRQYECCHMYNEKKALENGVRGRKAETRRKARKDETKMDQRPFTLDSTATGENSVQG